ncbi:DNA-directed RNA polymerase III subunit RPC3, partial [Tremellales sp. Uapishka_1]
MSGNGKDAVRLCQHIIRQAFGDVVCRVASTLLNRGRLPAFSISKLSALPRPTTLAALLILIQHNIVFSSGASAKGTDEEEMYEVDVQECLLRMRWGRILAVTREEFDSDAEEVVQQLMVYGKLALPEIIDACGGTGDGQRAQIITAAIIALVRGNFLQPTDPELHILRVDQIARRFAHHRRSGEAMPSAQNLVRMETKAISEVDEERETLRSIERVLIKSKRTDKSSKGKDKAEFSYSLNPTISLRINYDKFGVLIRNQLVVQAAEDRWNKGAAVVLAGVLTASLHDQTNLRETRTYTGVGLPSVVGSIPPAQHGVLVAGMAGGTSKSPSDLTRAYLGIMAGEDQMMGNGAAFLQRDGSSNASYVVELESICGRLKQGLLSDLVKERLGEKAARVLAVVARANKAGETMVGLSPTSAEVQLKLRQVRDCAMIPLKEARTILSQLQKLSLVETQEVPRTAAKSRPGFSASEFHLWQVDIAKVYGFLLSGVYKTLGNILQRKATELEKRKAVMERLARVEKAGKDREILSGKDQDDLRELDDIVKKLTLAEARTEVVVMILRDLPGGPQARV